MAAKLQRLDQWLESTFTPGSAPHPATARRWCEQGAVKSKKIGGQWYVYETEATPTNPVAQELLSALD